MYDIEFIETLKEYQEGRKVTFKGSGEYLIDTPTRVLNTFYTILKWRFENHFYLMPKKMTLLPTKIKGRFENLYLELAEINKKGDFEFLSDSWNKWHRWEIEYEAEHKAKFEKWNNWNLAVYEYLQNPQNKWQAVIFLNEMRCEECDNDFFIQTLSIDDDITMELLETGEDTLSENI